MDAFDLMSVVHDELTYTEYGIGPVEIGRLGDRPGFKTWPDLDMEEVERVGRSLAKLFGITLDE